MDLRPLGNTGIRVASIGLGTVKLGRSAGLKYAAPVRIPDDDEAISLLRAAADLGVNLIDTAPAYGVAEERLGRLLPQVAPRQSWVLTTKVGETFDPQADAGRGASTYDFSSAAIVASVERSLTRLRTQTLDVVLLHFSGGVPDQASILKQGDAIDALRGLQRRGLARAIGASTAGLDAALAAIEIGVDVLMLTLNHDERSELPALARARAAGIGVLVKKPLASGRLPTGNAAPQALREVLDHAGVASAVVGTTNPARLRALVAAN